MEAFRKGFYSRLEGEKGEGMNPKLRLGQDRSVLIFQAESQAQWPEVKFQGNKKLCSWLLMWQGICIRRKQLRMDGKEIQSKIVKGLFLKFGLELEYHVESLEINKNGGTESHLHSKKIFLTILRRLDKSK